MPLANPNPVLTDPKVTLRPWSNHDLPCVEEASLDPDIPTGTTVPQTYTPEAGLAFIERQQARLTRGEGLALAIAETASNEAVGHINLLYRPQRGVVGIGYWLLERRRGNRLSLHAVRLLSRWALRDAKLDRVEAFVEPSNGASIGVLKGAGFQREGLLRAYLAFDTRRADVFVYALLPPDVE